MREGSDSPIIAIVSRIVAPFMQIFALYVIFHGHYSPGGGFQGGAMLGASILLMRLAVGNEIGQLQFPKIWNTPLASLGVFIFAGTGVLAMLFGGYYLDYEFLPLPGLSDAEHRWMGILFVEVGVGIAVMATMVSIFDDLVEKHDGT